MNKKIILGIGLACSIAFAGHAQFGLGKIKDKVKDATKKDGKSDNSSSSSSSGSTTTTTSSSSSSSSSNNSSAKAPQLSETHGITSESHKVNQNKVVFAASFAALEKGKENQALFLKEYTLGDPLYYRAYTDNSIGNYAKINKKSSWHLGWRFKLYLDGQDLGSIRTVKMYGEEEINMWTTFKSALIVNNMKEFKDGATTSNMTDFIADNDSKFTVGKHVLKFELYPEEEGDGAMPVVATGELNVTVPAKLTNTSLCLLEKAALSDPKTEAELLKAANKGNGTNGIKITKVILLSDWVEIRGETFGTILRKEIQAINIGTENNGANCFYQPVTYAKNMYPAKGEDPNYPKEFGTGVSISCGCIAK